MSLNHRTLMQSRLFSSFFLLLFFLSIISVLAQDNNAGATIDEETADQGSTFEPDPDDGPIVPTRKPRFHRFNRFMKTINDFFNDGNWLQGGPENWLSYIGRTLSKLIDILLNRDTPDYTSSGPRRRPSTPATPPGTNSPQSPSRESSNEPSATGPDSYEGEIPKTNDGFAGYRESITRQLNDAGFNKEKSKFTMKDIMKLVNIAEQLNNMQKDSDKINGVKS